MSKGLAFVKYSYLDIQTKLQKYSQLLLLYNKISDHVGIYAKWAKTYMCRYMQDITTVTYNTMPVINTSYGMNNFADQGAI